MFDEAVDLEGCIRNKFFSFSFCIISPSGSFMGIICGKFCHGRCNEAAVNVVGIVAVAWVATLPPLMVTRICTSTRIIHSMMKQLAIPSCVDHCSIYKDI